MMDNREKKIEVLRRLIKDGMVTFDEALLLLEPEKEYVYQWYPGIQYIPTPGTWTADPLYPKPFTQPYYGTGDPIPCNQPYTTCENVTDNISKGITGVCSTDIKGRILNMASDIRQDVKISS